MSRIFKGAYRRQLKCLLVLGALLSSSSQAAPVQLCLASCIHLNHSAQRVVALNWSAAEMLLSLGVTPVGLTQNAGYRKWQTNHPELPEQVTELGRRQEPNLAAIAQLKPDLIIGYEFRHARLLSALEQIAPTLIYQQFPHPQQADFNYFEHSQRVFRHIAQALGKTEQAVQQLKAMDERFMQLKQQLATAGLANYSVSYAKFVGMGYGLRVFTRDSLAGAVALQLGLRYQWQTGLPGKDFTHLQLEQLPQLKHSHLILAGNQADGERMTLSPVWSKLPFVQAQRFSKVTPLWSFGGPESAIRMAEAFTQSLLDWQEQQHG
ncbi:MULTISPECIES: ABC transporter substrate-binding protein [unclassified Agarivorans]|uniref:ABC transporter substrate-binding protein n=1 Tax=unclassified Agarivorans TaxID=2636026 RepID=UPI003D7ECE85